MSDSGGCEITVEEAQKLIDRHEVQCVELCDLGLEIELWNGMRISCTAVIDYENRHGNMPRMVFWLEEEDNEEDDAISSDGSDEHDREFDPGFG